MRGWSRRENKYSGFAREVLAEPQVGPALCVMLSGLFPSPAGCALSFLGIHSPGHPCAGITVLLFPSVM